MNAPFLFDDPLMVSLGVDGVASAAAGGAWWSKRVVEQFADGVFKSDLEFDPDFTPKKPDGSEFDDGRHDARLLRE